MPDAQKSLTSGAGTAAQPAFSPHYTWTFPAAPVSFQLDVPVARDLRDKIAAAMVAHDEIWGILLGRTDASASPPATNRGGGVHHPRYPLGERLR